MGEFLLRHVGLAGVVNRIVPTESVEGGGQGLTAMTAAHDVNVGHWNHHLDGDRNTTAAQRIKGGHFIALRTFVQPVGQHLCEGFECLTEKILASLQNPVFKPSTADGADPFVLVGRHGQTGTGLPRNAPRGVQHRCKNHASLGGQLAQHPLKDMSGHGGASAGGPHIPSPSGKHAKSAESSSIN